MGFYPSNTPDVQTPIPSKSKTRVDPRGLVLKPAYDPYASFDARTLEEILSYKAKIRQRFKLEHLKQTTEMFLGLRGIITDPSHIRHALAYYGMEDRIPKRISLRHVFPVLLIGVLPAALFSWHLNKRVEDRQGYVQTYALFGGYMNPDQRKLALDNVHYK